MINSLPRFHVKALVPSILSSAIAFTLYCLQEWLRGAMPLGTLSTQVGDQFTQYLPFAAEYRRILLGTATLSSYSWSWTVGGGTPMHGNIATYDGGLLFPMVLAMTPEDSIEIAIFFIVGLSYAVAAFTMALLVRYIHSELHTVLVVLLGVSYALSSWAVQDSSYVPMWLSGHYMLPLLALVGIRAHKGKGFLSGVLVVSYTWWANYYTAFMASLGAGVFLVFWLVTHENSWRRAMRTILTFASQGILGVLIAAPIWLPTLRQILNGIEWPGEPIIWPEWNSFLGHLLPWVVSINTSPSFAAGSFVLLLSLLAFTSRALSWRFRLTSLATMLLLGLSFAVPRTIYIWNVFDEPNGNLWRAAFVYVFIVTVIASFAAQELHNMRLQEFLIPAVIIALLIVIAKMEDSNYIMWSLGVLTIAMVFVLTSMQSRLRTQAVGGSLLVVTLLVVLVETLFSNALMLNFRDQRIFLTHASWSETAQSDLNARDLIVASHSQSDLGTQRVRFVVEGAADAKYSNRGALLSLASLGYYSSLTPGSMLRLADDLGVTKATSPRAQTLSDDPVA